MLYNVTDSFIKVAENSGTIQNNSQAFTVEISDNTDEDSGYLLHPLNRVSFSGDIFIRCTEGGGRAQVNVVSFITDSGGSGGGSYVDDSHVAPDSDIDSLIDDIFGDDSGSAVDDSQVASDEDIDSLLDDIFGSDDSGTTTEPQVAPDADIDSLIEDIFTNGAVYTDDDLPPSTGDGVLVDDSQVASDEDIDNLINDIFG